MVFRRSKRWRTARNLVRSLVLPPAAVCNVSPMRATLLAHRGSLTVSGLTARLAGINEAGAKLLAEKWGASAGALAHVSTGRALKVDELADMEWKFGVTSATHELQTVCSPHCCSCALIILRVTDSPFPLMQVGNTFLQLQLTIDRGGGIKEGRHMELTLPQFYQFLMQMEKAKSQLDFMAAE